MRTKVILVDDHKLLIEGFKSALQEFGIDVIQSLTSTDGVIESFKKLKPDVLVLDIRFSGEDNGLNLCSRMIAENDEAKIVILSQFDQDYIIQKAYKMGALSFVNKDEDIKYLVEAICAAKEGKEYFTPAIAQRLARLSTIEVQPLKVLDDKELALFKLIADGKTNNEAAEELGVSTKTIGNFIRNIKSKLNISRTAEFTKMAIKYNLTSFD